MHSAGAPRQVWLHRCVPIVKPSLASHFLAVVKELSAQCHQLVSAIGVLVGFGAPWLSLILALVVIFTNVLIRPLAYRIHPTLPDPAQTLTAYEVNLICRSADESHLRTLLLSAITQSSVILQSIHSEDVEGTDRMKVRADLNIQGHRNKVVEQIVTRLSFEPGVSAISWSIVPIAME
jgi:putative Mg2+ transporter-C (MgtC) family protein